MRRIAVGNDDLPTMGRVHPAPVHVPSGGMTRRVPGGGMVRRMPGGGMIRNAPGGGMLRHEFGCLDLLSER